MASISAAIRALIEAGKVGLDRAAFGAGLLQLEAGGDFADAVIAHQGQWLGGDSDVDRCPDRLQQPPGAGSTGDPLRDFPAVALRPQPRAFGPVAVL